MSDRNNKLVHFHFNAIYESLNKVVRGILFVDDQGNIYRADQKISDMTDYPVDTLETMSIFHLDESLTMKEWRKWWKQLEAAGNFQNQTIWRKANGKKMPVFFLACILSNASRSFVVYKVHLSAVNALFPLLQSCARYGKSAAWEWNLEKERFLVTDYFYTIFDLDPEKYQHQRLNILELLKDRLSTDQMGEFSRSIADLRSGKRYFEQSFRIKWKDTDKQIQLRAESMGNHDRVVQIRGLIKEIESPAPKLHGPEVDQKAQLLLDNARTMICWIRPDSSLSYINPAFSKALGYSEKELLEKTNIHQIDIENARSQWDNFRKRLKEKNAIMMETSFQRQDGTVFPVSGNIVRLDGEVIGLLAQDISRRRQEEAQLKAGLLQINQLSQQLEAENQYLQEEVSHHFENIISQSKAYAEVLHQVEQVAPTDSTVLIEGESGTGKELIAHAIHRLSQRSQRTLVKVNCAVLPESLIESELFGHEKGAFTGADKQRKGRFELADGGTILLDEVGELPLDIQVKLLRVIQEGEFERVGGNVTLSVNVRIIAATNRKLKEMVNQKKFREDLYYRLNVFPIENIPLRDRVEDIPLLTSHFLKKFSLKTGRQITSILPKDLKRLQQYRFPGNVRELENIIERAVILTDGEILNLSNWKPDFESKVDGGLEIKTMEQMQYDHIVRALEKTHWRVSGPDGAAAILDMHPQTLYSRMRKLGIKRSER